MISIIVPVYKTEKFLRQCLDSILQQTFNDWEMWIVDDGSPDNSPAICDEYAAKDKRIKVIHQNNQGIAMARNSAIKQCNGDMVFFVDSDDWIEPDTLASLANTMQETGADMVVYEHIVEKGNKSVTKGKNDGSVTILNREETLWKIFTNEMPSYVWLTLFKREIISLFTDMRSFEDHCTFFSWASNTNTTACLSRALYHYRMNPDSLLHKPVKNHNMLMYKAINIRMSVVREKHLFPDRQEECKAIYVRGIIKVAKDIARSPISYAEKLKSVEEVSEELRNMPIDYRRLNAKQRLRAYLLKHHLPLFVRFNSATSIFVKKH